MDQMNLDIGELEYSPSARDLTDAKVHHMMSEELWKPYRRVSPPEFCQDFTGFHFIPYQIWLTDINYRVFLKDNSYCVQRTVHRL